MSAQPSPAVEPPPPEPAPAAPAPDHGLAQALEAWRSRLAAAGVACRAVAFEGPELAWTQPFPAEPAALARTWAGLHPKVSADNPVVLAKTEAHAGADLVMATALQLPHGGRGVVGAALAPPHNERTIQLVLLSLGWLQLTLAAASLAHNQRAARLLELMGHVASQGGARAAAQEWINRSAAWVRQECPAVGEHLQLTLFEVRRGLPRWWVAADTAWAEKASPALHEAAEVATRAMVEVQEVRQPPWWALPLLDQGEPAAVLVARHDAPGGAALPDDAIAVLRASAGLAEPLLRQWREAERGLPRHALDALRGGWRKLRGPGHLVWKASAAAGVLALAVLLLWPVPERVNATVVIEGRTRQVVTAPFDGFIAKVAARPGERVARGQLLARLDDRELKLEQGQQRSQRDQAAAKLRQAMATRDAPAMALAQAELQHAEAQLALVEAKLARADLVSPIDGLVVNGDWAQQLGGPVDTGKEMFEVATTDGYRVVLHVPDRDIARVQAGQPGALRLTGQPQTAYRFEVSRVTATASVQDSVNGFRVEAALEPGVPALQPGMQGVGKVEVGSANLLTIWTRSSVDWLRLKLWSWWW